ncbi:MAG TPA: FAD-linked oxidase C-terminal domain-containing protein [Gemmatimonadales bacterium]|jgi:FAD/FMN-containing dehydrogenase/Fe-S oxidoreductase
MTKLLSHRVSTHLSRMPSTLPVRDDSPPPYADALAQELRAGTGCEVRFDASARAAWSTDASNYRQVPIGVVFPRTANDIIKTVAICRRHGAPVTTRGGGTSLAGQGCNVAVIIDCSRYFNRILHIDTAAKTAQVEPGCVLDTLRDAARPHGLTFGPDPATHNRCTLGGMIGNNSCGAHSVMADFYGPGPLTRHQVIALDILTSDGERFTVSATDEAEYERIIAAGGRRAQIHAALRALRDAHASEIRDRFVDIPRRVSGYNLDALLPEQHFDIAQALVGTEGTCVIVLGATVRLIDDLPARSLLVLGYPSAFHAADHVPALLAYRPVGLEGMDNTLVDMMRTRGINTDEIAMLPAGNGWLLVEFGAATVSESDALAERAMHELAALSDAPSMRLCRTADEARRLWAVREAALGIAARPPGGAEAHEGWEDSAVAPEKLGAYLRDLNALIDEFGYRSAMYGHFGQGCVHFRIDFDLRSHDGIAIYLRFLDRAADLVVSYDGSLSGEHGDGQARAIFLEKMYGAELVKAFGEFKRIWDPLNLLNPGKVVDPRYPDQDLRMGPGYQPRDVSTHFAFRDDRGSFANATARCVGVGACRRESGGTMCPSWMVTHEEEHSTRGRARLLFEMMSGDVIRDGWQSEEVKASLDLCLACKGCKSDCPVGVDMATYKAEFLSHYYQQHARPRAAHTMGTIHQWARVAAPVAPVVNWLASWRPTAAIARRFAGIAPQRRLPAFASPTLRAWFRNRPAAAASGTRVVLWPDTFSNYLRPDAAIAAVSVLEHAGCTVSLPGKPLCCGRPLYDWGMLDRAKGLWRETLDVLRDDIRAGVPIVGLEPSCVTAFRDELPGLFPDDADARLLAAQTFTLAEFLVQRGYQPGPLHRRALVHGHCHQKAVIGMRDELTLLDAMQVDYTVLDSGCCGMAGAFGFEADKYELSVAAAERVLMPAVRAANADTLIITNGFSCHEQIVQLGGPAPLHLAEVLAMALQAGSPAARR